MAELPALPAPLSDINGAIALGVMSYGVILVGGLIAAGVGGFLHALKDFSLPISMSFRLFGALLSGALVTELVYYYAALSYVLPVIVGVMFTLLHALIQAYVLTMLVSTFYGESTEKHEKKPKAKNNPGCYFRLCTLIRAWVILAKLALLATMAFIVS